MRTHRMSYAVLLVVSATCLTAARESRGDESLPPRLGGDSVIKLPSGTTIKTSSLETHPKWREAFPRDGQFFAEKHAEGGLAGMHGRNQGKLKGPSVYLYENGSLKALAFYPASLREGPTRVYDEEKRLILYARYKEGKEDGVTLFFKDGVPLLAQEWNAGKLESETLLAQKGSDFTASDDATRLTDAREKLAAVKKELADNESELKKRVRTWFADAQERAAEEKDKALRPAMMARIGVAQEKARQEQDARTAGAHPYSHRGGAAAADEGMATRDLKADKGNANALAKHAMGELHAMDKALAQGSRELYEFALVALEKATGEAGGTPGSGTVPPNAAASGPGKQKTFVVTYKQGGKNGQTHTEEIRAASVEEAKGKVREHHPHAKFKSVEEK